MKININFNPSSSLKENQETIFRDTSRFKVAGCGRRFGKSYLATFMIIIKALEKEGNYFFVAPTFAQARQILWEILKSKTRDKIADKINESRLEVTLINGSKISLKGADRPDTMRGVSLSGVVLDEFATMREPENVWQQVLRPALSDQLGWALFISSPMGRNYFYDLYNSAKTLEDWNSWQFTTVQGGYVPKSEIESAMNDLDERTFRQEYNASFESYDGLVCPNFDRKLNESTAVIEDYDTLIMGVDFNVNKMPCIVHIKRGNELHAVDEFFGSFNTNELMDSINIRYPKHKKIFHTDASGNANKSSAGGRTDIDIIRGYGYEVYNLSRNPNIIDRVNAHNSMICSTDKTRLYFIHPRCKKLTEAHEKHTFDDNGLPNKKHEWIDDVFDGSSYASWHYSSYGNNNVSTYQGNFL